MAAVSYDTFERYKQKGLDARRAGQWESARVYLLEAARAMVELSKDATTEDLRQARRDTAAKLLELAKDCQNPTPRQRAAASSNPQSAIRNPQSADGEASAADWIVREKPKLKFDDIAGLDGVKEEIRLKMLYPFEHPELAQKFAIKAGGGVLLYGPPGTGKTMLAQATAGEIEATFFRISPADVMSKWVGEAEQNIKKLLDAALAEPRSIIFIDEIEALIPARKDEGSSVMQRVVPQLLQAMQGFDGRTNPILWMGATNVPWQLDPAVLRPGRFDEKIYIPLPDLSARRRLLELNLAHRPIDDAVDLAALAGKLDGYSGADIKYLCDQAATIPFLRSIATGQDGEIDQSVLDEVLAATPRSVKGERLARFEQWARDGGTA